MLKSLRQRMESLVLEIRHAEERGVKKITDLPAPLRINIGNLGRDLEQEMYGHHERREENEHGKG